MWEETVRADRLVSILMLLQTHARLTARELAGRLEVSERTIMRDMDALSGAGVPVFAERGTGGGWSLLEPYRLDLTGLSRDEIRALFLAAPGHLLADLGLRQAADAARVKLGAALSAGGQDAADISERILVDTPGWRPSTGGDDGPFRLIQQAVMAGRRMRIAYQRAEGEASWREVDPLGLVAKGSVWYLVAAVEGEPRTYRVSRVKGAEMLDAAVERPDGFRLAEFWAKSAQEFVANLPRYPARIRVAAEWAERVRSWWRYAHIERIGEADADGWCEIAATFDVIEIAAGNVLSFGPYAEVIEPEELKALVREWARAVAERSDR